MEWIAIVAVLLVLLGLVGSVLPVLPGPPLAWAALLILKWSGIADYSVTFLVLTALVTIAIELLDYFLPAWLTRFSGGSKMGQRGAMLGIIVGLIFGGPLGLILGPVLGAMAGELLHNRNDTKQALKSGFYSFIAFLLTSGIALLWCGLMGWWVMSALSQKGLFSL